MNLNNLMEFDHPIRVREDGSIADEPGVHAPNLLDDELDSPEWEFFTNGYSGQDRYSGPIMHNSEFIGGRLAEDILSTPGVYTAIVAYWSPEDEDEDEDGEYDVEGWTVVRRQD